METPCVDPSTVKRCWSNPIVQYCCCWCWCLVSMLRPSWLLSVLRLYCRARSKNLSGCAVGSPPTCFTATLLESCDGVVVLLNRTMVGRWDYGGGGLLMLVRVLLLLGLCGWWIPGLVLQWLWLQNNNFTHFRSVSMQMKSPSKRKIHTQNSVPFSSSGTYERSRGYVQKILRQ